MNSGSNTERSYNAISSRRNTILDEYLSRNLNDGGSLRPGDKGLRNMDNYLMNEMKETGRIFTRLNSLMSNFKFNE